MSNPDANWGREVVKEPRELNIRCYRDDGVQWPRRSHHEFILGSMSRLQSRETKDMSLGNLWDSIGESKGNLERVGKKAT